MEIISHFKLQFIRYQDYCRQRFFVMFECETKLQLGYFNGFAVNGHKILTEVSFHEDKLVDILVSNKEINLTDIQISSTFLFDSKVISGILDGIRNLNLCKDVANSDMSITKDTLIGQTKKVKHQQKCVQQNSKEY